LVLQAIPAPYQLPEALSREAVLPAGNGLLIIGGLTRGDVTADAVTRLNPVTGEARVIGRLAAPVHDAAGAVLAGLAYVFGGGVPGSLPLVQAVGPDPGTGVVGRLPAVRMPPASRPGSSPT
jgi:hypothetical protein